MYTIGAIILFLVIGGLLAQHNNKKEKLFTRESNTVLWVVTGFIFFAYLFFPVENTPAAWTAFAVPIGYHSAGRQIADEQKDELETKEDEDAS